MDRYPKAKIIKRHANGRLRTPGELKLRKEIIMEGHDLQGEPIGEIAIGVAEKGHPYYGISLVGVNNQRKCVVFQDPAQLDTLIEMLAEFRNSDSFLAWSWQQAVRT